MCWVSFHIVPIPLVLQLPNPYARQTSLNERTLITILPPLSLLSWHLSSSIRHNTFTSSDVTEPCWDLRRRLGGQGLVSGIFKWGGSIPREYLSFVALLLLFLMKVLSRGCWRPYNSNPHFIEIIGRLWNRIVKFSIDCGLRRWMRWPKILIRRIVAAVLWERMKVFVGQAKKHCLKTLWWVWGGWVKLREAGPLLLYVSQAFRSQWTYRCSMLCLPTKNAT